MNAREEAFPGRKLMVVMSHRPIPTRQASAKVLKADLVAAVKAEAATAANSTAQSIR